MWFPSNCFRYVADGASPKSHFYTKKKRKRKVYRGTTAKSIISIFKERFPGGSAILITLPIIFSREEGKKKKAFLLNNSTISSRFRSHSQAQDALSLSRPGFDVEPGPREKALLAEDPALKRFKSHKKSVGRVKRVPDGLIIGFDVCEDLTALHMQAPYPPYKALCLQVCAVVLMRVVDRNEEEERAWWIEKQKREVLE
ncbi:uncharacterized protein LOC110599851 [Manihot esculenta]|uniref:uncharacterized protein LOC110599851 n=1 Tax=Manihot esculenta TaxID=3983 RepID=UPI000B5D85FF|nr:uncharacterized protein LOC110599851 [Manihot esculenta]